MIDKKVSAVAHTILCWLFLYDMFFPLRLNKGSLRSGEVIPHTDISFTWEHNNQSKHQILEHFASVSTS